TRKYTDKAGVEKYSTEIIVNEMTMLGGKAGGAGSFEVVENQREAAAPVRAAPAARPAASPAAARPAPAKSNFDNFDDDIPF
ncbi:MAG: single-stranded DNA-binding protein, partial [Gallionella sp.]